MLPTKEETLAMMEIMKVLSERSTNILGDYEVQYAYDPIAVNALKEWVLLFLPTFGCMAFSEKGVNYSFREVVFLWMF